MRILYVLPQFPYPADRGGKVVLYNTLEYMRRRHEVSVVALTHGAHDLVAAGKYRERVKGLWTFPCRPPRHLGTLVRSACSSLPFKALRFRNPRMATKVTELATSGGFDLIHAQNYYAAQYVRPEFPTPRVYYKENFEGLLLERCAAAQRNPFAAALLRVEGRKTARLELDLCGRFDRVYTITRTDLERIRDRSPDLPLEYMPPAIDTEAFAPAAAEPESHNLIFVGTLDYFPNADGLTWFHREVLPLLRRKRDDVTLTVVGRRPKRRFRGLERDPAVRFTGWVESVIPIVHRAATYVAPLRIGGGVRLKILEAMALGKAVVTTTIGCEGIECTPGVHLAVADTAEEYAEQVLRLLADREGRARLGRNARALAVERYSIPAVLPRMEASYLRVVEEWRKQDR